ncbi:MAG: zinc ribbon domain-containing protein [Candidatus Heimdallarchaeota archaeon]
MVFCSKCGSENPEGATTCSNCGTGLSPSTRPRRARRSSNVCWEEEQKGIGRGGIITIGIVFICTSFFIYIALTYPEQFSAFWENFGTRLGNIFESGTWALIFLPVGIIIIVYALFFYDRKR